MHTRTKQPSSSRRILAALCACVLASALAASGQIDRTAPNTTRAVALPVCKVSVTPSSANLRLAATQQFRARVSNAADTAIVWSMDPSIGALSSNGLYTAPSSLPQTQTVHVTATSVRYPKCRGNATVTITVPLTVSVSPASAQVTTNHTLQLTATSNSAVTWTVSGVPGGNASFGAITSAGLYTAPVYVPYPPAVTVTATSVADPTQSASSVLQIVTELTPLAVLTSSLPGGAVGASYKASVLAAGGATPYGFTLAAGPLPPGLSLSPSGALSGTPAASGAFKFTVRVTDAGGQTASQAYAVSVTGSVSIVTTSLPDSTVGTAYRATLVATGGTAPYVFSVASGQLPGGSLSRSGGQSFTLRVAGSSRVAIQSVAQGQLPAGLSLSPSGTLSGTPAAAGSSSFTIQVTDAAGQTASRSFTASTVARLSIATSSLPNGTVGSTYTATAGATGGTAPYTFSVASGQLPKGLTLNTSGTLSGTPAAAGTSSFTIQARDAVGGTASRAYSVSVATAVSMVTTSLPGGTVGTAYSATVTATGGTAPYAFSVAGGQLPAGLTLSTSGGLSGTPAAAGSSSFTIQVADAGGKTASRAFTTSIVARLSITTNSLPNGTVGSTYSATVSATGGTAPYTFSLAAGQLPAGLTVSASGSLSGTPTAAGSSSFTIQARDAGGQTASKAYAVSVTASVSIVTTSLPDGVVGTAYSTTVAATGGTAPYTFVAGLPQGLNLSATTGQISGTPATNAAYNVTMEVTDAGGRKATKSLGLVIAAVLAITTTSLPDAAAGVAYVGAVTAIGGIAPLSWAIDSGQLPPGLSLDPASGAITGRPTTGGTYSFSAQVRDLRRAQETKRTLSMDVTGGGPSPAILTNSLHLGYIQQPYNAVMTATGGTPPYLWTLGAGQLPPGLLLRAVSGEIVGTPTAGGQFSGTINVRDSTNASSSKTFTLEVFEQEMDKYGGMVRNPCPNGPKAHFYTQKIGSRWHLCTPAGNAFWMNGMYHVDDGDTGADYQNIVANNLKRAKYATGPTPNADLNWTVQAVQRLRSWGFNTLSEYSYYYTWPVATHWQWGTPGGTIPVKQPFVAMAWPSRYSFSNSNNYANGPVKEIVNGIKTNVYAPRRLSADWWDPNFAQYLEGSLEGGQTVHQALTGPNNDYLVGLVVDETDDLWGFGAGPDFPTVANGAVSAGYDQPHLGWMVLVTAPTQSSNSTYGVTYTDTTVYSKQELKNWLSARYGGNIGLLNLAWGSNYTSFGSSGGWGSGKGLLDEDGLCPAKTTACWVPTDPKRLAGATAQMKQDLDDFLYHHVEKYYSIIKAGLQAKAPGVLLLGSSPLGSWGAPARRQVLQAASQHLDLIIMPSTPAKCSNCTDIQQRIDFVAQYGGDKPWLSWEGYPANADSYMSPYASSGEQLQSQAARGQLYEQRMQQLLNARDGMTGTYHLVGLEWWEMYDNRGERINWGLVTRRDNPYDGVSATTSPGADSWGYPTGCLPTFGCEQASYGDFITPVRNANIEALRSTAGSSR